MFGGETLSLRLPGMHKSKILGTLDHRPFPLPRGPWVMQQTWKDLLFLHYRVPPGALRDKIPAPLELDTFNGDAWITIAPLKMRDVKLRWVPRIPTATNFLELNFRTYVRHKDKTAIYFFSLDTDSSLSALGARMAFLPYYRARMSVRGHGGFRFQSERWGRRKPPATFEADFTPGPELIEKSPLDEWLVERYRLFQVGIGGTVIEINIHHAPWALRKVDAQVRANTLAEARGFALPDQEPIAQYARRQEVLIWPPGLA
jgi:uncharacterized protein